MFEHFSSSTKRVLELARYLAGTFGHSSTGTVHILLASCQEGEETTVASRAIQRLGLRSSLIRERLENLLARDANTSLMSQPPWTAEAQDALDHVTDMARERGKLAEPDDLLLGINWVVNDGSHYVQLLRSLGRLRQDLSGALYSERRDSAEQHEKEWPTIWLEGDATLRAIGAYRDFELDIDHTPTKMVLVLERPDGTPQHLTIEFGATEN